MVATAQWWHWVLGYLRGKLRFGMISDSVCSGITWNDGIRFSGAFIQVFYSDASKAVDTTRLWILVGPSDSGCSLCLRLAVNCGEFKMLQSWTLLIQTNTGLGSYVTLLATTPMRLRNNIGNVSHAKLVATDRTLLCNNIGTVTCYPLWQQCWYGIVLSYASTNVMVSMFNATAMAA